MLKQLFVHTIEDGLSNTLIHHPCKLFVRVPSKFYQCFKGELTRSSVPNHSITAGDADLDQQGFSLIAFYAVSYEALNVSLVQFETLILGGCGALSEENVLAKYTLNFTLRQLFSQTQDRFRLLMVLIKLAQEIGYHFLKIFSFAPFEV